MNAEKSDQSSESYDPLLIKQFLYNIFGNKEMNEEGGKLLPKN